MKAYSGRPSTGHLATSVLRDDEFCRVNFHNLFYAKVAYSPRYGHKKVRQVLIFWLVLTLRCCNFAIQTQLAMKLTRFFSKVMPLALFAIVMSCNEEAPKTRVEKNVSATDESAGEQLPDVDADRMLVVELEGMVCEMGCGGSIRKDLYGSEAVATVSFEFDEDKAVDVARVAFDRDLITADEIVAIINTTNDGQFKVNKYDLRGLGGSIVYRRFGRYIG